MPPQRTTGIRAAALLLVLCACNQMKERPPAWGKVVDPSPGDAERGEVPGTKTLPPRTFGMKVGHVPVQVRLAVTDAQRSRGLAGVRSLGESEGMLFVYRDRLLRNFWMKGCLIALDIAYIDDDRRIFQVGTLKPPAGPAGVGEIRNLPSQQACSMVLEMPAGFFGRHGLGPGARIEIPASVPLDEAR